MSRPQKKHWIMVKRGLSADPKHREAMGQAVWCFLHIIDRADFETGKVYDWRDGDEAEDMGVNERTLRSWRQALEKAGYIKCQQRQRGLEITIWNWINPRDYSAGIVNPQGDKILSPSDAQGDKNPAPSEFQGDMRVDIQGDMQVPEENVTPTYSSDTKIHESNNDDKAIAAISKIYQSEIGMITPMVADALRDAVTTYPPEWIPEAIQIAVGRNARNWKYVETVLRNAKQQGKSPNLSQPDYQRKDNKGSKVATEPKGFEAGRRFLERQGAQNG